MKIICAPNHLDTLKSMLREYQQLDIVIVEKGFDYEGMCYYFSMEHKHLHNLEMLSFLLLHIQQSETVLMKRQ